MCFVGFTFKKASEENNIKKIVTLFDEIETARQVKKTESKREEKPKIDPPIANPKKETTKSARNPVIPLDRNFGLTTEGSSKENPLRQTEGKIMFMGPYSKGGISLQRSGSNDGKNRTPLEPMSSPKKNPINILPYTGSKPSGIITSSKLF